ncbi:Transposase DDE domain protein [Streptomyces sp. MA5143a]|nr:Transposase DDE domain protein [Streptomyces sp. MA5143a]
MLIVDGTLVPTRDHTIAEQSKNNRCSTNHQVVIDADTRLVVAVSQPLPGNRNDGKAWELSGAKDAVGKTTVIADGGYRGTGLVILGQGLPGHLHGQRRQTAAASPVTPQVPCPARRAQLAPPGGLGEIAKPLIPLSKVRPHTCPAGRVTPVVRDTCVRRGGRTGRS